jgi:hypothetical protein
MLLNLRFASPWIEHGCNRAGERVPRGTFAGRLEWVKSLWTNQLHALLDAPFDAILMPDLPTHPFAMQSG